MAASFAALCAYLAISGGLRLSRSSARAGTALAVVVFLAGALAARLPVLPTVAVVAMLAGIGQLSGTVTGLVRRLVTDEVAKTTLSQMYKEAALAIEAREQVLRIVTHDLRNPLHTIAMAAELLIEADLPKERQQDHLRRITRAGERMNRLVQDLLDVAKLEAGRLAIAPREIDVPRMLREAHGMLAPLAAERSIDLALDIAEPLPRVSADEGRIIQVLSNIVGNALKFTPVGGKVVIGARAAPGSVHFSVSDTGPGIPPDKLDRIFGRFWQADPADRRGIGLGLTIAKSIMDAHDGRLWVESRVGSGTTFHFVLGTATPGVSAHVPRDRRSATTAKEIGTSA
jgi:signal transduction histidine kinase